MSRSTHSPTLAHPPNAALQPTPAAARASVSIPAQPNAPTASTAAPVSVPPELDVRWPKELLDASPELAAAAFVRSIQGYVRRLSAEGKARFAMCADTPIYEVLDLAVFDAYDSVHPKHRLTRYHDFFVDRIQPGERTLDLGCGLGLVAASIAERSRAHVTGIDWLESNLTKARAIAESRGLEDHLTYVLANICADRVPGRFDAIVLSNVFEHVTDRPARLRQWVEWYQPKRVLIRVPMFERDYRVPLKQELGIDYRLDNTHEIEHTEAQLRDEIQQAGLEIEELITRWCEYWVHAVPH